MEPLAVDGLILLSDLAGTMAKDGRTCVIRLSDGARKGHLRFEHGKVVEVCFGKLEGSSAMVALTQIVGLRHEVVEAREETRAAQEAALASASPAEPAEAEETEVAPHEPDADPTPEAAPASVSPAEPAEAEETEVAPHEPDADPTPEAALASASPTELTLPPETEVASRKRDADPALPEAAQVADSKGAASEGSVAREGEETEAEPLEPERLQSSEATTENEDDAAPAAPPGSQAAEEDGPAASASPDQDREPLEADPSTSPRDEAILEELASSPEETCEALDKMPDAPCGDKEESDALDPPRTARPNEEGDALSTAPRAPRQEDAEAVQTVAARRSDWPKAAETKPLPWGALSLSVLVLLAAALLWERGPRQPPATHAPEKELRTAATTTSLTATDTRPPQWSEGPAAIAPAESTLVPSVRLRVLVAQDGKVQKAEVVAPRPELERLEQRAIETALKQRYRPALSSGVPIEAWTTLSLTFAPAPGGSLVIKGSDTIANALGAAWTEAFAKIHPELKIRMDALGTKTGFAGLLDGSADLAAASHVIGEDELALAARLGIGLREVILAEDAVAVIVHPDNPLQELDLDTLGRIFTREITNWDELSGDAAPIRALGRPSYSGTRESFEERVILPHAGAPSSVELERVETGRQTVERVANDPYAIGYVSLSALAPSVRAVRLKERLDAAAILPTHASVQDGSYPLAQTLLLYLRADASYAARTFVQFALSQDGRELLPRHALVALPSAGPFELGALSAPRFPVAPDLTRIYFESSSAHIAAAPWDDFWAQASRLHGGQRALIIGHTDSSGDAEANRRLARTRASVVKDLLERMGGKDAKIELEVARSEYPLASNDTTEGKRTNRRVDVYVLSREQKAARKARKAHAEKSKDPSCPRGRHCKRPR